SPHWLTLEIGQRTPQPFERPEAEACEPQRAGNEQEQPHADDNEIELIPLHVSELAEAVAVENRRADKTCENVASERHLSDRRQRRRETAKHPRLADQHDDGHMSERDG